MDFFTGIAVVNPNAAAVDVTIQIYGSDGTLLGFGHPHPGGGREYVRLIQSIEGIGTLPPQASGRCT